MLKESKTYQQQTASTKINSFSVAPFLLIAFFLGGLIPSAAQKKLQVITKTVEKSFTYKEGVSLEIRAENATINVRSWDKPRIRVVVELIAKNPTKEQADFDLKRISYEISQQDQVILARNSIEKKESLSSLRVVYTIYTPEKCPVSIHNEFGRVDVADLFNSIEIKSSFSRIFLDNLDGSVDVATRFGDIQGFRLAGSIKINAHRSDILLKEILGAADILANYGLIRIFDVGTLTQLKVNARHSNVQFFHSELASVQLDLETIYGKVYVSDEFQFTQYKDNKHLIQATHTPSGELPGPKITFQVSFGDITLGRL